ncbi:MAG: GAF domain-containing protein [Candidatus Omnitrophica bacterium]|nr:GAF domain-containing protein [Candidatus Omnitrophota bacterium]
MPKSKGNLKNKVQWLEILFKIAKEVNSNLGLKRCLKSIIDNTVEVLNVERSSLMLLDKQKKELRIEYAKGISREVIKKAIVKIGVGVSGWVAKTGKPLLINDISKDRRFRPREKGKYYNQSLLSVPLKARDQVIGVLNVNNKRGKRIFTKDDLELLSALANEASIAVSNARLYQELLSANERLKELDLLKSDFVANVSHELGTPLATCRYFTSLMLKEAAGAINKQQRDYLQLMDSNIERLTRLINNLLSLSRIEAGRFDLKRLKIKMADLSTEVLRTFEGLLLEKQIDVENRIPKETPDIYADRERIIEVFTNLIGNAIKFSPKNSKVLLDAKTISKSIAKGQERKYLRVEVTDTGKGIEPDSIEKIFSKFEQLDRDLPQREKGTGLGLAISREILKLHKGEIWAESELNKGSSFFFTLPIFNEEEHFFERVSDEINRARSEHNSLSLVVLAVENFSKVKTRLSRDEILGLMFELEAIVKKTVRRPNDVVIRFKKGEILAILADTNKEGAYALAGRVRESLEKPEFNTSSGRIKLNFEIGVVTYPDDALNETELVNEANKVLTKKEGK